MENKTRTSKKSAPAKNTRNPVPENPDVDNVDKIRDILFGRQMRAFDQKHMQLEERLAGDLAALRKENALQIESLQTFIESEIGILAGKLAGEEKTRIEQLDDLDGEFKKSVKQIDNKMAEAGNALDNQAREINQKILKQSQDFTAEMNAQLDDARKRMDGYKQELSSGKVDKSALAEMLNTLALHVNADDSNLG